MFTSKNMFMKRYGDKYDDYIREILYTEFLKNVGEREMYGEFYQLYDHLDIIPPKDIQEAMEKQMRAERERRESILRAEGEKKAAILLAEGEKESTILRADAKKEAQIREAEGKAKALLTIKEAEATGLKLIKDAKIDDNVLKLKSYEALVNVANGQSNTIIVPSDLQNLVSAGTVIKETLKK